MVQTDLVKDTSASKRERQSETVHELKRIFALSSVVFYRDRLDALLAATGLLRNLFVQPTRERQLNASASASASAAAASASASAATASGQSQRSEQPDSTASEKSGHKKLFHAFSHQLLEVLRNLRAAYSVKSPPNETAAAVAAAAVISRPQLLESLVDRLETLDASSQWDSSAESSPAPEKQLLSLVDCAHLLIKS